MRCMVLMLSFVISFQPVVINADEGIAIIRRQGAPAPFTGVLYSDQAYARMKAADELREARFQEKLKHDLGIQRVRLQLATATTAADLNAERRAHADIGKVKDDRIASLEQQLLDARPPAPSLGRDILFAFIGAGAVAVGGLVVAAVAGAFTNDDARAP